MLLQAQIRIFLTIFILVTAGYGLTQVPSHTRYKTMAVEGPVLHIEDSLSIVPKSPRFFSSNDSVLILEYRLSNRFIEVTISDQKSFDSIRIQYQVFPYDLEQQFYRIDTSLLSSVQSEEVPIYTYEVSKSRSTDLLGGSRLDYDGSFARGLSFGNRQDLVLESAFNLQAAGEIGDDILFRAAISDNQIPIQPEGNTRQLQEFDRVYISLQRNQHELLAGDFDVKTDYGHFMKFFKKLKGAQYSRSWTPIDGVRETSKMGFAISRGKLSRQQLEVSEQNQGPYKLIGQDGELFVIILAGSEKVYFDGALLTRGSSYDYVIDYNLGEITFTPFRTITKDSRIIVEFEYVDQQFSRTLVHGDTRWTFNRGHAYLRLYHEQDGRTPSTDFELDSADIQALRSAGDDFNLSRKSGISPIAEDIGDRIRYGMKDTFYLVNGVRYDTTILFQTADEGLGKYIARFTDVGPGQGNYQLESSSLNGRVYRWVAPDPVSGKSTGSYSPWIRLVPPKSQQMMSVGGSWQAIDNLKLTAEVSSSRVDQNRYSSLDDRDNLGMATYLSAQYDQPLREHWSLSTLATYEYKHSQFRAIKPYRPIEFERDWNVPTTQFVEEHLPTLALTLSSREAFSTTYRYSGLFNSDDYSGHRHHWQARMLQNGWSMQSSGSYLQSQSSEERTNFLRPSIQLDKSFGPANDWKIGVAFDGESNRRRHSLTKEFVVGSASYQAYKAFVKKSHREHFETQLSYEHRRDQSYFDNDVVPITAAHDIAISSRLRFNNKGHWNNRLTWRSLDVLSSAHYEGNADKNLMGRSEFSTSFFDQLIRLNTLYEVTSGQEPKLEFVFEERRPGEGDYIFQDFNEDGVAQINEFILAPYADTARFVRLRVFNSNFVRTNNLLFNTSLRFDPQTHRRSGRWWTKWSLITTAKSNRKTSGLGNFEAWNPLAFDLPDSALVTQGLLWSNTLFVNKGDPKFDIRFMHKQQSNKHILVSGFEIRSFFENAIRFRYNVIKPMDFVFESAIGRKFSDSETFDDRDYDFDFIKTVPKIDYRVNKHLRLSLAYLFDHKQNDGASNEQSDIHDVQLEMTYRSASKHALQASLSIADVSYNGQSNSALEFVFLEGLKPGANYVWRASYDRKISGNVIMRFQYNGRKTGVGQTIHTGSAQLKASF